MPSQEKMAEAGVEPEEQRDQYIRSFTSPRDTHPEWVFWEMEWQGCGISLDGLLAPGPQPWKRAPAEAEQSPNSWNVFEPHKEKWELGKQVILAKCTVFA